MTPARMFDGDLYVLAADAVQMAENAYKNGQSDEREACAKECEYTAVRIGSEWMAHHCAAAIRARSNA